MLAIIKTGGKQYLVRPDQKILIEKIPNDSKDKGVVFFDKVLLIENEENLSIGKPFIKEAKVEGEIIGEKRLKKVKTFKAKAKKRYLKRQGHRQTVMEVRIKKIILAK